ncbi:orotidine 5-phosphate decarboxylase [Sulfitobacter albidus]|uniref:Orotidine 5-phosphate decarboxylase n=1 Tax=Sulfitobacter albidus TaxID=2829501 RepID=A0A975JDP6_9RHOB|nr:orotidine 5-phosphate decarboxylase [Sulfitobacter albidus]QUJ76553.1 orotidine 5-phosphate decarboxylase [Sulfitobacter albidus]
MNTATVTLSDVTYNAGTQCFEARAHINDGAGQRSYACAIDAPINMSFEQAADGLRRQALRRDAKGTGLRSQMRAHTAPQQRAGRARFDPRTWLAQLGLSPDRHAA